MYYKKVDKISVKLYTKDKRKATVLCVIRQMLK